MLTSPNMKMKDSDATNTLLCFLKYGANLLAPQTTVVNDGKVVTNAMLVLIENRHFELLKQVCRFYQNSPRSILEQGASDTYWGKDPLSLAIENGADYELVSMMLNLGFSPNMIDRKIQQDPDFSISAGAMKALYEFYKLKSKELLQVNTELRQVETTLRQQLNSNDQPEKKEQLGWTHK